MYACVCVWLKELFGTHLRPGAARDEVIQRCCSWGRAASKTTRNWCLSCWGRSSAANNPPGILLPLTFFVYVYVYGYVALFTVTFALRFPFRCRFYFCCSWILCTKSHILCKINTQPSHTHPHTLTHTHTARRVTVLVDVVDFRFMLFFFALFFSLFLHKCCSCCRCLFAVRFALFL